VGSGTIYPMVLNAAAKADGPRVSQTNLPARQSQPVSVNLRISGGQQEKPTVGQNALPTMLLYALRQAAEIGEHIVVYVFRVEKVGLEH